MFRTRVVPKLPGPNLRDPGVYSTPSMIIMSCLVTVAEAQDMNVHVPLTVRSVVIAEVREVSVGNVRGS